MTGVSVYIMAFPSCNHGRKFWQDAKTMEGAKATEGLNKLKEEEDAVDAKTTEDAEATKGWQGQRGGGR